MMSNKLSGILARQRAALGMTQEEVSTAIGKGLRTYQYYEDGKTTPKPAVLLKLAEVLRFNPQEIYEDATNLHIAPFKRYPKTSPDTEAEGITFVPISAQAGYAQRILEPFYADQLERVFIPGFPYRGPRYRVFEIEGDSMLPTFKEGYYVLGEEVEQAQWQNIKEFHAYVVVTTDEVFLKRLAWSKKKENCWVLISDNDEYGPFVVGLSEVREVWFVRRKIDWDMAPPKRFEIDL